MSNPALNVVKLAIKVNGKHYNGSIYQEAIYERILLLR